MTKNTTRAQLIAKLLDGPVDQGETPLPAIGTTVTATEPKGFGQYPPDFPEVLYLTLAVEDHWTYAHPRTGRPVRHVTGTVLDCNYAPEIGRVRSIGIEWLDD